VEAYKNRGLALFRLGKDAEAQKDIDRYLRDQPAQRAALDRLIREAKRKRGRD
jgi:Tfp pilus assembly protein PilF